MLTGYTCPMPPKNWEHSRLWVNCVSGNRLKEMNEHAEEFVRPSGLYSNEGTEKGV